MTDASHMLGPLVIVSGLPAAGKSTLSARLGRDLGFPVVHRDRLRRFIFDGMHGLPGAGDLLPAAGDRLVIGTVGLVVEAGLVLFSTETSTPSATWRQCASTSNPRVFVRSRSAFGEIPASCVVGSSSAPTLH